MVLVRDKIARACRMNLCTQVEQKNIGHDFMGQDLVIFGLLGIGMTRHAI
jgi:hypothetical protein